MISFGKGVTHNALTIGRQLEWSDQHCPRRRGHCGRCGVKKGLPHWTSPIQHGSSKRYTGVPCGLYSDSDILTEVVLGWSLSLCHGDGSPHTLHCLPSHLGPSFTVLPTTHVCCTVHLQHEVITWPLPDNLSNPKVDRVLFSNFFQRTKIKKPMSLHKKHPSAQRIEALS